MKKYSLNSLLAQNEYPGRGIIVGLSPDSKNIVSAYFIMGRSENSRNRIFKQDGDGLRTQAYDESKMSDPSLIIYSPVRVLGNDTIITNGDQTDTIYEGLKQGLTFEQSLRSREAEPDAPNYTPRISALLHLKDSKFSFAMNILKTQNGDINCPVRNTFCYEHPTAGFGRFIHTYMGNGSPLPSFEGEPELIELNDNNDNNIDDFTTNVWNSLNNENKISLFVRYINISDGSYQTRILNKNN